MTIIADASIAAQVLTLLKFGGVSPRLFNLLLQQFGSPAEILDANTELLQEKSGMSARSANRIESASRRLKSTENYLQELGNRGITIVTRFEDNYMHLLLELNDPPPLLYVRGKMPSPQKKSVTLLGTHSATAEGIALTTKLARLFAEQSIQVVSSLDGGNDSAAHLGAKVAGGESFAVVDAGFDTLDQQTQVPLAIDIAQTGGVISECPPELTASERTMESNDRLLVGITEATVITELYHDSKREHDILNFCSDIGKMAFVVVDDSLGPLTDAESIKRASACGAIILHGSNQAQDITRSLV